MKSSRILCRAEVEDEQPAGTVLRQQEKSTPVDSHAFARKEDAAIVLAGHDAPTELERRQCQPIDRSLAVRKLSGGHDLARGEFHILIGVARGIRHFTDELALPVPDV